MIHPTPYNRRTRFAQGDERSRFLAKVLQADDGHWYWLPDLAKHQQFRMADGRRVTPTRAAREIFLREVVPSTLDVCQGCGIADYCVRPEHTRVAASPTVRHGMAKTPEWQAWRHHHISHPWSWPTFELFYEELGPRPDVERAGLAALDRSRPIGPGNAKWDPDARYRSMPGFVGVVALVWEGKATTLAAPRVATGSATSPCTRG